MSVWTFVNIEAYCMYNSISKKEWKMYEYDKTLTTKDKKPIIKKNGHYIPKSERPKWCVKGNKKRLPKFRCMCYGKNDSKCPFFAFCDADKKDYIAFEKAFKERMDKEVVKYGK